MGQALPENVHILEQPPLKVLVPKHFLLGPVFAATKQSGPREITIGNTKYTIGGFHPVRRNATMPAMDIRHARATFSILHFPWTP